MKDIKEKIFVALMFLVAMTLATNAGDIVFRAGSLNITGNLTMINSHDISLKGGISLDDDSVLGTVSDGDIRTDDGLLLICDNNDCDNNVATGDGDVYAEDDLEVDGGLCIEGAGTCDSINDGDVEIKAGSLCIGDAGCQPLANDGSLSVDNYLDIYGTSSFYSAMYISTSSLPFAYFSGTQIGDGNAPKALELRRTNTNPADNDGLGITFKLGNDNVLQEYVDVTGIYGKMTDVSDGTEDGSLEFHTVSAGGALTRRLGITTKTTIYDVMNINPLVNAPANPVLGDVYVDSTTNEFCFYDGNAWTGLRAGGACA